MRPGDLLPLELGTCPASGCSPSIRTASNATWNAAEEARLIAVQLPVALP